MASFSRAEISASGFLAAYLPFFPIGITTLKCWALILNGVSELNCLRKSYEVGSFSGIGNTIPDGKLMRSSVRINVMCLECPFSAFKNCFGHSAFGNAVLFQCNLNIMQYSLCSSGSTRSKYLSKNEWNFSLTSAESLGQQASPAVMVGVRYRKMASR